MTVTLPVGDDTGRPAHRDGNVLRWLGAYAASMIGDSVYYMALAWAAARTGSAAQTGLVLAAGSIPRAVLLLGGGVLADRLGPRRVVVASDTARCLVILGLAGTLLLTSPTVWMLIAVALVFGAVDALFLPAVGALPPRITAASQLARVQGMRGLATRTANVVGAPLGGVAVALGGPVLAFAAAGVLFAVSLPLLLAVRMSPLPARDPADAEPAGTAWRELADGLGYIRRHPMLGPLMLVVAVSELGFVGPLNLGLILLSDERGWGASGMGWVIAAFGIGAGASALLLTVRGRVPRAGLVMCLTVLVGAVAIAALAYVPSVPLAAGVAVLVGLFAGLGGALCGALTQTAADPAYLGRVTSVSTLFTHALAPLSYPVTGAAVALWGTGPVFVASASLCAAGAMAGLLLAPLRRAELPG
ncbi:MFS transporter [Streptomyces poriferorum]|uniref:MFS transporter n=1 Tax=Streptomyces poriferorum TaxID=2798799 RepID=A0ABY9IW78_9ACTN|nr:MULTISPECIES: MFS transporter [Streptomyces]MBW5251397.1 MFS transporter [Streptomyces poriferorum]MDP5311347.1 MFS transporter [Streptomyces sp. Alt4]WLQ47763.1 MFS transporter [Streptomyces sp. Alt1]WLQ59550.1 MFS transporter [Streptomyces sp. Alt2]